VTLVRLLEVYPCGAATTAAAFPDASADAKPVNTASTAKPALLVCDLPLECQKQINGAEPFEGDEPP